MLPTNGRYGLTQTTPPPVPGTGYCEVRVVPGGLYAGPWFWTYFPAQDVFSGMPGMGVECLGNGQYRATGPNGSTTGTCVLIP